MEKITVCIPDNFLDKVIAFKSRYKINAPNKQRWTYILWRGIYSLQDMVFKCLP